MFTTLSHPSYLFCCFSYLKRKGRFIYKELFIRYYILLAGNNLIYKTLNFHCNLIVDREV